MATYYVITKGEYSNYHIVGVTMDKKKAEKLAERFSDRWEKARIEECTDDMISEMELGRPVWWIEFSKKGEIMDIAGNCDPKDYHYNWAHEGYDERHSQIYVVADTKEAAIKIASEKRAEYLAHQEGIA